MAEAVGICCEAVHHAAEVIVATNLNATTTSLQRLRLTELLVVGTENNGDAPNGSLNGIVDTHTEATTDVGDGAIAVDAREQTKTIDDQSLPPALPTSLGLEESSTTLGCKFCVTGMTKAYCIELFLNLLQVVLADDMGRNDELPLRMLLKPRNKDFLVRRPAAACNENLTPLALQRWVRGEA